MCLTLVCQAGTDIVIQQYDDAQELCKQAQEIADHYGITLPQPEKLQNNFLIAEFLQAEAQAKSEKVCLTKARQTFSKLKNYYIKSRAPQSLSYLPIYVLFACTVAMISSI